MWEIRRALELRPDDTNILYNAASGILNVDWARRDPDLACLHQDPDFLALIGSSSGGLMAVPSGAEEPADSQRS